MVYSRRDFLILGNRLTMKLAQMIPPFKIYTGTKRNIKFKPLLWSIFKKVPLYSNILKKSLLSLHGKLEIINYPRPDELLNKRYKLISKCSYANNFSLRNYKTKH